MSGTGTVFIGNITKETHEADLRDIFERIGPVVRIDMKSSFAFLTYEDVKHAEDAVAQLNGIEVGGSQILVELPRANAKEAVEHGKNPNKLLIGNVSDSTSWQDLKDWARHACPNVIYTNVFNKGPTRYGIVEFEASEDIERILQTLFDRQLGGNTLELCKDDSILEGGRGGNRRRGPHSGPGRGSDRFDGRRDVRDKDVRERDVQSRDARDSREQPRYDRDRGFDHGDRREDYSKRGFSDDRRPWPAGGRSRSRSRSRDRLRDRGGYRERSRERWIPADPRFGPPAGYGPPPGWIDDRGPPRGRGPEMDPRLAYERDWDRGGMRRDWERERERDWPRDSRPPAYDGRGRHYY